MLKVLWIWYEVVLSLIVDLFEGFEGDELVIVLDGLLCVVFFVVFMDFSFRYFCEFFRIWVVFLLISLKLIVDFVVYYSKKGVLFVGNLCLEEIVIYELWNWDFLKVEEEVKLIGEIFNIKFFIGKIVIKEEVLKCFKFVILVYIVV